ncbi:MULTISPECIES: hypothetical protein [unclassified Amycolatopsis]|uniref:hypothetical protein n=1 Tax=unclassified Amycolatopsis TaxID=2618356 RepID=UPI001FF5B7DA|nr:MULTISPECIES: hypothetical protein [unclassified Amycolatopsis]UOZ02893.1 hypothetical protein MUY22_28980 [Amycolatopsis sp. WQ 127309]WSJ78374.1 hypothetical protein OG439_05135 [Amycolatopsis sp. NBC_01307]WSK78058.1 hypothetical protein OG570_42950 [Amycolatopsis sp. NBC_01286]
MTSVLTGGRENARRVPPQQRRPDGGDPSAELTRLAALADLARRSTPPIMHRAILAGGDPASVAAAARLSAAQAHIRWHEWAGTSVPLDEYLRVHTAFADAIGAHHDVIQEI